LVPCIIGESRLRVRMRLFWAEGLAERLKAATAKVLLLSSQSGCNCQLARCLSDIAMIARQIGDAMRCDLDVLD
jgi:hypothetical protein